MSQNLWKRAITNNPKVDKFIFSIYHIFLLKGKFNFFQILAMEYFDHEVNGISVSRQILISVF